MPSRFDAYKLFVASPGGLDEERQAIRDEVQSFNESEGRELGLRFDITDWHDVAGGMDRPQGLINTHLQGCDYMILLLWDRWGLSPERDGRFSSGTEEEFHVGKGLIGVETSPMTDILVLFKGVPAAQLRDPGPQLTAVLCFKQELEDSKEVFFKDFDDLDLLRREVRLRLQAWARDQQAGATRIVPSKHRARTSDPTGVGSTALVTAEAFEAAGQMTQAEAAYAEAIADDGLDSLEKYARFLRRTGRMTRSLRVDDRILKLAVSRDPGGTVKLRAKTLASMGIIHRKQGDLLKSRYALKEAVQTARQGGDDARDGLAYALDNLGITLHQAGDSEEARECFEESLAVRAGNGDSAGRATTLTHLARLHRRSGALDDARVALTEATRILEVLDDRSRLAAAHSAMGEILQEEGRLADAEVAFRESLAHNEALGRPDAIAMSLNQLARILLLRGQTAAAERHAERSLRENESISNREGIVQSTHLLGRILGHTDRTPMAMTLLNEAIKAYHAIGNRSGEGQARLHLAEVLRRTGDHAAADRELLDARSLAERSGDLRLLAELQRFTA